MEEKGARPAKPGGDGIIHAGFIPLADCAPLIVAKELGFDREEGISLRLHREVSWANIRDKTDLGIFDCAHMLAPMPIASSLGLGGRAAVPVIAPVALNLNGNAITVSNALHAAMLEYGGAAANAGGMEAGKALAAVIDARRKAGAPPLTLGMVYPFSCHNYDLRYWLAAAGVDPDLDVRLAVIPPPLIADSLHAGAIDGFCVGAPWGAVSVEAGQGRIVATKAELWRNSPEKVLGVRLAWSEENPEMLEALIRALLKAAAWLEDEANLPRAAQALAAAHYVGAPETVLLRVLTGRLIRQPMAAPDDDPDFLVFGRHDAAMPWLSHAVWIMTQMARWGQLPEALDLTAAARRIYRPDLLRSASGGRAAPGADFKREGEAGTAFFGGESFDPTAITAYMRRFAIRAGNADLEKFAPLNF